MAYPLQMSDHKLISHAVSIAILLPNIMEFNMMSDLPKFAEIAALMGENVAGLPLKQQAQRSVAAVRELIADVGLPTRMRDVNVQKSDIPGYVDAVFKNSPHLVAGNSRLMTPQQMAAVFEAAW
jgi:alcohol dehydrogenase